MAEFKLGRIRFIWKGAWGTGTQYFKDDVIRYGGRTYICIVGHTASGTFEADQSTKWNNLADGQEWKSDWALSTVYKPNDIVKYGSLLYVCNTGHTSASSTSDGLELDQSKWDLWTEGFDWKGVWGVSTRYKVNDIVAYGGDLYLCTEKHTSAASTSDGLELDNAKWDTFARGLEWRGNWTATTRYRINDVIKYGGQVYVCNAGHTAAATNALGLEANQSNWDSLHKGIDYKGNWATTTRYKINDLVKYGGDIWICTTYHTSTTTLAADESNWAIFVPGLEFEDSWQNNVNYQPGDVVTYGGYSYISKTNNYGATPFNNTSNWDLFTTGFSLKGDYNNTTNYKVGDVVRVGGWTYLAIADGVGNRPPDNTKWDKLNQGFYWKNTWTNGAYYDKGDTVRGINNINSYVCVLEHTADQVTAQNRPDQDLSGTYWNLLSGGVESGNLTTRGDLVYYGGAGPTRLAIGSPGQVLKVNDAGTDPVWAYFGQIEAVYYVAPTGVDEEVPAYGVTIDKPFKTVQFGLQQIEKGARKPYATQLLRRNKAFIVAETLAWVDRQISTNASPFSAAFTYTASDWSRDLRHLLDGVEFDLSHGGNRKSRQVALNFFRSNSFSYYVTNSSLTTEWAAMLAYMKTLIDDVLTQNTPSTNYQTLMSVSPATLQIKNAAITEEVGGQAVVESLIDISRNAIVSNSATSTTYNVTAATYDGATGDMDLTIGSHSLAVNTKIVLKTGSLTFTCDKDNNVSQKSYPRTTDPAYVTPIAITSTTGTTIRVNVGKNPDGNYAHTFVSATAGAVSLASGGGIPAEIVANDTLFVKTGTFPEVLPMVIPESCAVVGDELRSTKITPAGQLTSSDDTAFSLYGILHMKSIIDNIILNTSITKQTNNPLTQDTAHPAGDAAAVTKAEAVIDAIHDYINYNVINDSTAVNPTMSGQMSPNQELGVKNAILRLEENKDFIAEDVKNYILNTFPGYTSFDATAQAACKRDVRRYVEAVQHDILYDGTYMAIRAGRLYANSVSGSTQENMFFVRNGTGIRNMTVSGLSGTLGVANSFGTKRPSAGAYVSLDPGWGPAHEDVWVKNKSCYVQNVTTFGTGCIGLKIDGDLHAGGNDSVVANDFTQVLSDGIGVWVTNLGRSELVSVFSYYGHIGYLAENGGKIRATNGNSSYGDFGCVAEGVDATETPITGFVDNKAGQALVANVTTDGERVLTLEYLNAGRDYDLGGGTANIAITGEGYNLGTVAPVYRTGGVMEVRMLETQTSPSNLGGADYKFVSNNAQIGNATQITISNTDTNPSGALVGLGIFIKAGLGAGQYAYIDTYNSGTKVATVRKYSDGTPGWDHLLGESILNLLDSTTAYEIEPRITFAAPVGDGSSSSITALGRATVVDGKITQIRIWEPGQGYLTPPAITITDPNNTVDAPTQVRIGDGVLAQPTYTGGTNAGRGQAFETASASVTATLTETNITGITLNNPIRVTASGGHTVQQGAKVKITEVVGTIEINDNTYFAKVIDANNIDLFRDPDLNDGIDGTLSGAYGTYLSGGKIKYGGGFRDQFQSGQYVDVVGMANKPVAGSNVQFSNISGTVFKLVSVTNLIGQGPYSATLQVSPNVAVSDAPAHHQDTTIRIRYSQVRLTGHDFLDIGTGNFASTNYPNIPLQNPIPANETRERDGGRVFFTSTDQDGNFRVGGLFTVEQSTGVATLNADAFNISGLQELSLGSVALGSTGATINEFSTDGSFAANSDSIVPTQKAIKTYITSQIGGGASTLNVNQITAGLVQISGQEITTTTVVPINVNATMNFKGGVDGTPVALNMFLMG